MFHSHALTHVNHFLDIITDEKTFMRFKAEKMRRARNIRTYTTKEEMFLTHNGAILNYENIAMSAVSSIASTDQISIQGLFRPLLPRIRKSELSLSKKFEHTPDRRVEPQAVVENCHKYVDTAFESLISTKLIELRPSQGTKENNLIASTIELTNVHDDYDALLGNVAFEVGENHTH